VGRGWSLNSGFHTGKVSVLPLEPHSSPTGQVLFEDEKVEWRVVYLFVCIEEGLNFLSPLPFLMLKKGKVINIKQELCFEIYCS
jgi:hypothetical protein